jgi:hypothetical protein
MRQQSIFASLDFSFVACYAIETPQAQSGKRKTAIIGPQPDWGLDEESIIKGAARRSIHHQYFIYEFITSF